MNAQRECIAKIRKVFGYNLTEEPSAEVAEALSHLRGELGNGLDLLAGKLNSDTGHFFVELLQNADDASYPPGVLPAVSLEIWADRLMFSSNELGFKEDEVRALCAVGRSTKRKNKKEKTGEKGIGFKSVFKVSDRPEVHSNGYHFRFHRKRLPGGEYDDIGMVVPEWVETPPAGVAESGSTILLPLKPGLTFLFDAARQLRPELLLFLRKVRQIAVVDHTRGERHDLMDVIPAAPACGESREQKGTVCDRMAEIAHTKTVQGEGGTTRHRFFVHSTTLAMDGVQEPMRPDVARTELTVALPLDPLGAADASQLRDYFAFLPVNTSGFKFVANADFILVTNREDVERSSAWNDRVRDALSSVLADAIIAAQKVEGLAESALCFVTDPAACANEFLRPVLEGTIRLLGEKECVPTAGGDWCTPKAALRPDSGGLASLVGDQDIRRLLGRHLVRHVSAAVSAVLDTRLRCERFQEAHLLACCQNAEWLAGKATKPSWFVELYSGLGRRLAAASGPRSANRPATGLEQWRKCRILLLASNELTASEHQEVFRGLGGRTRYGFEHNLKVLHHGINDLVSKPAGAPAGALLRALGVLAPDPVHIIDTHILRRHQAPKEGANLSGDAQTLRGHLRFVRDHLADYPKEKREVLSKGLYIQLAKKGDSGQAVYWRADQLYLGRGYGDPHGLESLLGPKMAERLVSPEYIQGASAQEREADRARWQQFFCELGVNQFPRITQDESGDCSASEELAWALNTRDHQLASRVLLLLDDQWNAQFQPHMAYQRSRGWNRTSVPTTLREQISSMFVPSTDGRWVKLSEAYLDTDGNRVVFGNSVPYLAAALKSQAMIQAVEVAAEPTVTRVLDRLKQMSGEAAAGKDAVGVLYKFLDQHFQEGSSSIQAALLSDRLVYLEEQGQAVWARGNDCRWDVPAGVRPFAPVKGLRGFWDEFKTFFCERVKVPTHPSVDHWVQTLTNIAGAASTATGDVSPLARLVYRRLNDAVAQASGKRKAEVETELRERFRNLPLLRTKCPERPWRTSGEVVAADDAKLESLFSSVEAFGFLDLPASELPSFSDFLDVIGAKRLSREIRFHPLIPAPGEVAERQSQRIRSRAMALARSMYHQPDKRPDYKRARREGHFKRLGRLTAFVCERLHLAGELRQVRITARFKARIPDAVPEGACVLYVERAVADDWDKYAIELARFLGMEPDTVCSILRAEDLDGYFEERGIPQLPDGEIEQLQLRNTDHADSTATYERVAPERPGTAGSDGRQPSPYVAKATSINLASPTLQALTGAGRQSSCAATESTLDTGITSCPFGPVSGAAAQEFDFEVLRQAPGTVGREKQRFPTQNAVRITRALPAENESGVREKPDIGRLKEIEDAAIERVLTTEAAESRHTKDVRVPFRGYHVQAGSAEDGAERLIVVKGLEGLWGDRGVVLTKREFESAQLHAEKTWLYVVEFARQSDAKLLRVPNPASLVDQFVFDKGWVGFAEGDATDPPVPAVGARIRLDDGRIVVINAIDSDGAFTVVNDGEGDNEWVGPMRDLQSMVVKEG